jgi:hypothetical protein
LKLTYPALWDLNPPKLNFDLLRLTSMGYFPYHFGILSIITVMVVYFVLKVKNKRLSSTNNGYNKFDDAQGTNAFATNSQPYFPFNPQASVS